MNRTTLTKMVADNRDHIIVVKFGAEWCGPCKRVEPQVSAAISQMPANVHCYLVDIDESIDLFAFLKSKKVVSGVPTILAYYPGSIIIAPENSVSGSDVASIDQFFNTVYTDASSL
jgi:thioredoxin 1